MSDCSGPDCKDDSHGLTLKEANRTTWCTGCDGTGKIHGRRTDGEVVSYLCPNCLSTGNPHESLMLNAVRAGRGK